MKRSSIVGAVCALIAIAILLLVVSPKHPENIAPAPPAQDSDLAITPKLPDTSTLLRDTAAPLAREVDTLRRASGLIIPVAGIRAEQLVDTYTAARSEGRTHNAIDIMAAKRTPVLAAANGVVKRLFKSVKGGITLYQLSEDEHTVYYYAHLDAYADGIAEGKMLRQGEVLGYVGDTGNAGPGNYHLHFAIWKISDPENFWMGEDLNPYPLLRQ